MTETQKETMGYVTAFHNDNGIMPTCWDLTPIMNMTHECVAHRLNVLVNKGYLVRASNKLRLPK